MKSDERSQHVVTLGRLLHAAGLLPLLVGAVVYYAAYRAPLSVEENQLMERVTHVTEQLKDAGSIQRELAETTTLLEQQRARAAGVRRRIPDGPDESEFLQLLSHAAMESGISIQDFTRGTTTDKGTFSQLDITLQCAGSYECICRFLDRLEDVPRLARVISLELDAKEQQDPYPLQLIMRLYFGVRAGTSTRTAMTPSRGAESSASSDGVSGWSDRFVPIMPGGDDHG